MKTLYYPLALLVVASSFTACKNEEDDIFEDSAANRLDKAKVEFTDMLASEGGKWAMEYFSNEDEPGYVMVLTFSKGGDVKISGNHKWLTPANTFQSQVSLWEMIDDNGPVLTFNSYNNVFHVFSNPENITGPFAPTNPDRDDADINETGYGHNGDYEFIILGEAEAGVQDLKLLGKKRGLYTWLHRLPADTDDQAYLDNIKTVADNMFSERFVSMTLTDGVTGEKFVLTKTGDGLFEAYPMEGDAVMQTVSANAILTDKGIRFMNPFEIPRADEDAEPYVIESLALQPDGSLLAEDGSTVTAHAVSSLILSSDYKWAFNFDAATGNYASLIALAKTQTKQYRSAFTFSSLVFSYDDELKKASMTIGMTGRNSRNGIVYFDAVATGDNTVKLSFTDDADHYDQAGGAYLKNIPAFNTLIEALTAGDITYASESVMVPDLLTCHVGGNTTDSFVLDVR